MLQPCWWLLHVKFSPAFVGVFATLQNAYIQIAAALEVVRVNT
jgi:hypothetical protein